MSRILLINHYAGSLAHGMEYRSFYFAREWVKSGHEVLIVAASYSHLRRRNPTFKGGSLRETVDGVDFAWMKTPEYEGNGARRVGNMLAFLVRLRTTARKDIIAFNPDLIIASSTYPWDNWVAAHYARICRATHIYEVHDLWPLTPMELGDMSAWHPFIISLQLAEDFACRHADHVISLLPHANRHLETRGMAPHKFAHIPNGVDPEEWSEKKAVPDLHMDAISAYRAKKDFIVAYVGGHGVSNSLDTFVEASAASSKQIGFVSVGDGPEKQRLTMKAKSRGNDMLFLPSVPKSCVPSLLSMFDALYLGWERSTLYRFGISPNKLYDYMMSGLPIIHAVDAANDPVSDARCGMSVPPDDAQAAVLAIKELASMSSDRRRNMGSLGLEYVLQHNAISMLADRFLSICTQSLPNL